MNDLQVSDRSEALSLLPPVERGAYEAYAKKKGAPLSPTVQAQLFSLYLNGNSCEEIAELNKNFTLGMIVKAKVDGLWDLRLEAHRRELLDTTKDRVTQIQLESALFAADLLAAANKLHGEKLRRYIQTGDEGELGADGMVPTSIKQYKDAVDLLMKVTGQENNSKVTIQGEQKHTIEVKGKLSPQEAALLLAGLEK